MVAFAGLAAGGGAALVIASLMFTIVAMRLCGAAALGARAKTDAVALSGQTIDAAAGVVRDGSRETLLTTLAATAIIAMLIGRSR